MASLCSLLHDFFQEATFSASHSAHMSGDRGCQGEVAVPWRNSQRGNSIGPVPKPPNDWASIKSIVAHPFGGVRDDNDPLPNFASAPGDFVACCQSGADENCSITRPGGVKEPGVTNIRGECCSSFYSNSGNWDDCVPQRRAERMAQNSILQCQNTEARNREGAQLHRRCSRKSMSTFGTDEHLQAPSLPTAKSSHDIWSAD